MNPVRDVALDMEAKDTCKIIVNMRKEKRALLVENVDILQKLFLAVRLKLPITPS